MNVRSALAQEAERIVSRLERGMAAFEAELAELESKKAKLQAQLHASNLASDRLLNYPILVGADYQCPSCWIQNEARSKLRPMSGTDTADIMACNVCAFSLTIPIDC